MPLNLKDYSSVQFILLHFTEHIKDRTWVVFRFLSQIIKRPVWWKCSSMQCRFWLRCIPTEKLLTAVTSSALVCLMLSAEQNTLRSEEHTSELQSPDHLVC